jgi:iron complex outermembrane receptor protein
MRAWPPDYAVYDMISREATAKSNYITFDADWNISDSLSSSFR